MQEKTQKTKQGDFSFHIKTTEHEVMISGTRDEVMKTIDDLPRLIVSVNKAFETLRPKTVATLTVKTEATRHEARTQNYPKITSTNSCGDAVLRLLDTDWGKWRPRTFEELKEALKANGLIFSGRALPTKLMELVKSGKVRRWNTDAGFVYILAEKEALDIKGEAE